MPDPTDYDLTVAPWISVRTLEGQDVTLSLTEVLLQAHRLSEVTATDPVTQAAMMRFLIAVTAQLVRSNQWDRADAAAAFHANTGFVPTHVDLLIDVLHPYMNIVDGASPFMQDATLPTRVIQPVEQERVSVLQLDPTLPGENTAVWFSTHRANALRDGMSTSVVAPLLVSRWFYSLIGNCTHSWSGKQVMQNQTGGTFSEGKFAFTHLFRSGPSLFQSLLSNLTTDLVSGNTDLVLAFTQQQLVPSTDRLYQYTASWTSTLLAPPSDSGRFTHMWRTGRRTRGLEEDTQSDKALRDSYRAADPHRMTYQPSGSKKPVTLVVKPEKHLLDWLHKVVVDLSAAKITFGLADPGSRWIPARRGGPQMQWLWLCATKVGSGASPKWEAVQWWDYPESALTPDTRGNLRLRKVLSHALTPKTGVFERVIMRALFLGTQVPSETNDFPPTTQTGTHKDLEKTARQLFCDRIAARLEEPGALPDLRQEAFDVVSSVLQPFRWSSRYALQCHKALAYVRRCTIDQP